MTVNLWSFELHLRIDPEESLRLSSYAQVLPLTGSMNALNLAQWDPPFSCILFISSRNAPGITAAKEARYAQITYKNLLRRNWNFTLQKTVKPLSIERGKY